MQLTHDQNQFSKRQFPITIVCDTITSPANVGAIFRAADAFGVEKVMFCGGIPDFGKRMRKTSRSTEQYVPFEVTHEETLQAVEKLKEEGYTICAVEITANSVPLNKVNFKDFAKVALVLGAENFGVNNAVLQISDVVTHITMYGNNSSMNVAQALTIALYESTNALG